MNAKDRKKVSEWIDTLIDMKAEIENMQEDQQEKYDNLPEGLQDSANGEALNEAADTLQEAASNLDSVIDNLQEIVG
jgi:ABC-type transporter Mla subunit MlaD